MKTNKRAALYTWFENKRKEVIERKEALIMLPLMSTKFFVAATLVFM